MITFNLNTKTCVDKFGIFFFVTGRIFTKQHLFMGIQPGLKIGKNEFHPKFITNIISEIIVIFHQPI